jgi:uncharacterized peroxidase-related enzyme
MTAIDPSQAPGKSKELLAAVHKRLGLTPNMMRTMAHSPAVLEAYLSFSDALGRSTLGPKIGEQLALAVAEANGCGYCAAAHTALGRKVGLTPEQTHAARLGQASDPRAAAALRLAQNIVERRGNIEDEALSTARAGGLGDPEIAEVVAYVALNIFTNYFNHVAATEIDFPRA